MWGRARFVAGVALVLVGISGLGYLGWEFWGTTWLGHRHQREAVTAVERTWLDGVDRVATPWGEADALVRIPRFGSSYQIPVLEGSGAAQLSAGFGHMVGTAAPGAVGNVVLAAHRVTHGEPLRRMSELRVGDHVIVVTRRTTYDYRLVTSGSGLVVPFTAGWVTEPRPRDPSGHLDGVVTGDRLLTLVTCAELFHTDNRMVAFATLVGTHATVVE